MAPLYLKPNVIAEPLFNQWYAWSYLIPPVTAAKYLVKSHLPIMESFVAAPQVHAAALKNSQMMGGSFINYDASRVWEIANLLENTKSEQRLLLDLEKAIDKLDNILETKVNGDSLEPLYTEVPDILKGYIELVYDRSNNPSVRYIENLFYHSPFYSTASQSIMLSLEDVDNRAFVLSTPRLPDNNKLQINLPFSDRRWDNLFKMRENSDSVSKIAEILEIPQEKQQLFSTFFTTQIPKKSEKYKGDSVRIRYFGHACILIETTEVNILCDPLIAYENKAGIERYSYEDLPEQIDYAIITHNHQDHVMFETLLQIRYKVKNIVIPKGNKGSLIDPSLKLILQQIGFNNVRELDELESITIPDGEMISLPVLGEHGDLNISTKNAYLIKLKNKSILLAADSNNIEPKLYQHIYNCFGSLDIMFIGMECDGAPFTWAYGALLPQTIPYKQAQNRRLDGSNAQKAIALVKQFSPQQVYVYAMGQEPWLTYITSIQYTPESQPIVESNKLINYCRENNIISNRLYGHQEIILERNYTNKIEIEQKRSRRDPLRGAQTKTQNNHSKENYSDTEKFIQQLQKLDIKLTLEQNELAIDAPKGILTNTLIVELKNRKPELIKILKNNSK